MSRKESREQNEREQALHATLDAVEKRWGKGAVMRLGDRPTQEVEVVSTGSIVLDRILGVGGYPRGRVIEIFGHESSGKTTLSLHAIAEIQRAGGTAAFVDAEHALDVSYAGRLGVEVEGLLVAQPDSGEQALEITEALVRSGAVDLVVVDSVAALVPQAELEGEMGDHHVGLQARLMSQALRKLTGITSRTHATVIFINQVRSKIGGMAFGPSETTTGGNALKFYSSIRLDVRRIGSIKTPDGEVVGHRTKVKVIKNKLAPPFRVAEIDIVYGRGVCRASEVLNLAEQAGIITRSGTWYSFGEEKLGQGREKVREQLQNDAALFERVRSRLLATPAEALAK